MYRVIEWIGVSWDHCAQGMAPDNLKVSYITGTIGWHPISISHYLVME